LRDLREKLDQDILDQILGAILDACESKRQSEKAIQVRPQQGFEFRSIFVCAVYGNISCRRQIFRSILFSCHLY